MNIFHLNRHNYAKLSGSQTTWEMIKNIVHYKIILDSQPGLCSIQIFRLTRLRLIWQSRWLNSDSTQHSVITPSLRHRHCLFTPSLRHRHCRLHAVVTPSSRRRYAVVTPSSLPSSLPSLRRRYAIVTAVFTPSSRRRYAVVTPSLRRRYAVITPSLRRYHAVITPSLRRRYAVVTPSPSRRFWAVVTPSPVRRVAQEGLLSWAVRSLLHRDRAAGPSCVSPWRQQLPTPAADTSCTVAESGPVRSQAGFICNKRAGLLCRTVVGCDVESSCCHFRGDSNSSWNR